MWTKWGIAAAVALLVAGVGCGEQGPDDDEAAPGPDQTGLAVAVDYQEGTDVEGFEFGIAECDGAEVAREALDVQEATDPDGPSDFVDSPFADDAGHQFAEYHRELDGGCYDVEVQPLTGARKSSEDCKQVEANEVFVVEGEMTEIVMTSECGGQKRGAADLVAALNNPPVVETVEYQPSKFVHECEKVDICVTAYDPDGDPMEFEFEQTEGQKLRFDLEIVHEESDGKRETRCMRAVPVWNDDYQFEVTVYDMVYEEGEKVRVEDAFDVESRGTRTFEMYSNWDIEPECYDRETELFHHFKGVRDIDRAEGCIPIWPEEFFCSDYHWDELERTCPDGEFAPETVYPLCEDYDEQMYESEGRSLGEDRW